MEQLFKEDIPSSITKEGPENSPESEVPIHFFNRINYSEILVLSFSEEKNILEEGVCKSTNANPSNDSKKYLLTEINDRALDPVDCNTKAIAAFEQGYLKFATNLLVKILPTEENAEQKTNILQMCIYQNNLGCILLRKKEYVEALAHFHKAYFSITGRFTERNIMAIIILNNIISLYYVSEQFEKIKDKEHEIQIYLLAENILTGATTIEDELRIKLYENYGHFCNILSGYKEGQMYLEKSMFAFEKVLEIAENNKSKNTVTIARSLENLAEVFYEMMDFQKALNQIHKVIEIKKEIFGDTHLEIAKALSLRSKYYRALQDIPAAIKSEGESLEMKKKLFKSAQDENNISSARCYGELGRIYHSYEDYNLASQHLLSAIKIAEDMLGKECNEVAGLYRDIGLLKISQSQYNEALSFLQNALEIYKKIYGETHVNVAMSYGDLGLYYMYIGNYKISNEQLQKKSSMLQEIYGEKDPRVVIAREKIAELLLIQSRYEDAIKLLTPDTEGMLSTENHRSSGNACYIMGQIRLQQRLFQLAVQYFEQALTGYRAQSKFHSKIPFVLEYLGECFINQEKRELSLDYYNQAAEFRRSVYPEDHVCHGHSHKAMATFYFVKNQFKSVITELESALEIYTKHLGENHVELVRVYELLGTVYNELDDYENERTYDKLALKIEKKIFGRESFPVAKHYYRIAVDAREEESFDISIKNYQRALTAYKVLYGEIHEEVANLHEIMGHVYYNSRAFATASSRYKMALNIRKTLKGEAEDSSVADALYNIGRAERRLGNFATAVNAYMESLVLYKKIYGDEHIEVANVLEAIANSYKYEENYEQALAYYQNSLDTRIKLLGSEDRLVAQSYYNMGLVYFYQKEYLQALKVYLKALTIYENVYGQMHEEVSDVHETIARVYKAVNNHKKAIHHYSIAYIITATERGANHQYAVNIKSVLENLCNKDAKMTVP